MLVDNRIMGKLLVSRGFALIAEFLTTFKKEMSKAKLSIDEDAIFDILVRTYSAIKVINNNINKMSNRSIIGQDNSTKYYAVMLPHKDPYGLIGIMMSQYAKVNNVYTYPTAGTDAEATGIMLNNLTSLIDQFDIENLTLSPVELHSYNEKKQIMISESDIIQYDLEGGKNYCENFSKTKFLISSGDVPDVKTYGTAKTAIYEVYNNRVTSKQSTNWIPF